MQQTSLLAYEEARSKMGQHQLAVYRLFQNKNYEVFLCNQDIAELLKWPINSVTPRVKELREKQVLKEGFKEIHPITGRRVIYWQTAI